MELGRTEWAPRVFVAGIVQFYFSTWEEYHTKVLYLGFINGPVEGVVILIFAFLATGIWGWTF